jgi:hypothetical protein
VIESGSDAVSVEHPDMCESENWLQFPSVLGLLCAPQEAEMEKPSALSSESSVLAVPLCIGNNGRPNI